VWVEFNTRNPVKSAHSGSVRQSVDHQKITREVNQQNAPAQLLNEGQELYSFEKQNIRFVTDATK